VAFVQAAVAQGWATASAIAWNRREQRPRCRQPRNKTARDL